LLSQIISSIKSYEKDEFVLMPIIEKKIAIKYLTNHQVVAIPTETVYGLAANATNDAAVAKIYALKDRPQFNPLIIHVPSIEMVTEWALVSEFTKQLMEEFWIRRAASISFVLKLKDNHPLSLLALSGLNTVAVRKPNHPIALDILNSLPFPLAAPSANRSNNLSTTTAAHVLESLGADVPVVDGGACAVGLESTILDVTQDQMTLLRLGAVTESDLAAFGKVAHADVKGAIKAPGMLKRHYAPQRPLKMNVHKKEHGMAMLGFGDCPDPNLNLSVSGNLSEAAANLFNYLHQLDCDPFTSIGVSPIPDTGIGAAINDRLRRACENY
jgi:L-threonylcarbamoyladenylate synthase